MRSFAICKAANIFFSKNASFFTCNTFEICHSVLPRLRFCAIVAKILNMTQPKLSRWDIWRTLIFGLSQDWVRKLWGNSYAKYNFVFHQNSRSCNGCFNWCLGFLNCIGTSIQWQYVLSIIMKTGTSQFTPFPWTKENLLWHAQQRIQDFGWKEPEINQLSQNFSCPACKKEMQRLSDLRNLCMSTSCHSGTMPILAMHFHW